MTSRKKDQEELEKISHQIVQKLIVMSSRHGSVAFEDFIGELTPVIPMRDHGHIHVFDEDLSYIEKELSIFTQILQSLENMDSRTKPEVLDISESYEKYGRGEDIRIINLLSDRLKEADRAWLLTHPDPQIRKLGE